MEISLPAKRVGKMTVVAALGTVTVWAAVNDGKTLHVPASGDHRESVIFSRGLADTTKGLTPERVNTGVVMGTSGPVAMVRSLLYPVST